MQYYPLFLDLRGQRVLVVGAGAVGTRKVLSLLPCAPERITVVDPAPAGPPLAEAAAQGTIVYCQRGFLPGDIAGNHLVFAASGNAAVNALVADLCRAGGILCNSADAPEASSFVVPAHFQRGPITIALSTGGASPALARRLRGEMEEWLGDRFTGLAILLGRLRPLVLSFSMPTQDNTRLFRALVHSSLGEALAQGDHAAAEQILRELLPKALHPHMGELLHEL